MNNYVQKGETVTHTVAGTDVVSGQGLKIGTLFGVCATDAVVGAEVEVALTGVYTLPKKSADTPSAFGKAYWDDTNKEVTTTVGANTLIGVFTAAYAGGTTAANIRLDAVAK